MNIQDYKPFTEAWANAHEVMPGGKQLSPGAMRMIIDALKLYPLDSLLAAIAMHVQIGKFAPAPKDIIDLLDHRNKRISADEAWAMVPKDESETVVWTEEMASAYDVAYDFLVDGDKIAARMAFKGAYERFCAEAMLMRQPVNWKVSIGHDKEKIEPALKQAVLSGFISQDRANHYLPSPMDGGPIGKLLTGQVVDIPEENEQLRKRWGGIKQALRDAMKEHRTCDDPLGRLRSGA